ncbi:MAG TPA: MMPL family transporter, partial [Candidatus Dormibacteraeota bacterium]|nr:MMPL family transporter [Candidatus Dormibacteraeota bacterium]
QGNLSGLLNFTPQTQDPSIAVLIFCILFGLSMDYEVLMLNRIREEWRRTGDTPAAVAMGLERSGRLITGAAAIMVAVFASFGLGAGTVLIKALGIGLAVAITVDATLVRAVVVPAVMRLLGDLNWWAPRPLARLHRRLAGGEPKEREVVREAA